MKLSLAQEHALADALPGKWLPAHELFPHWVHRRDWTAERLYSLGFLERRVNLDGWRYEYKVKENG